MIDFSGKIVTVTGGTGSFGSTMVRKLLELNTGEIRVFSRDEAKQDAMRHELDDPRVRFYIGDVRSLDSTENVMKGTNYLFHAAAMKQVPSAEFFPLEAVATNVHGSANAVKAAINAKVESVVCLSTDKAAYPICAMGMTKALMEKTAISFARNSGEHNTKIAITRYGNVLASRGSVVPLFMKQIKAGKPITITQGEMTRFLMSLSDSVELVLHAFSNAESGDLFIKKAPAASVSTVARAVCELMGVPEHPIQTIGVRHGEKLYESLLTAEEHAKAMDEGAFFRVPLDTRTLDYSIYFDNGDHSEIFEPYHSHNTTQLNVVEVKDLLLKLPEVIGELK